MSPWLSGAMLGNGQAAVNGATETANDAKTGFEAASVMRRSMGGAFQLASVSCNDADRSYIPRTEGGGDVSVKNVSGSVVRVHYGMAAAAGDQRAVHGERGPERERRGAQHEQQHERIPTPGAPRLCARTTLGLRVSDGW